MTTDLLTASRTPQLFTALSDQPLDAMLGLLGMLRNDPREDKIDLGIGVYSDADGHTPVMQAVKAAEAHLVDHQDSKAYVAAEGDAAFLRLIAPVLFGEARAADDRYCGMQTPGGTGALRLAAGLIAQANPEARVWLGTPTWPNHASLMRAAGLTVMEHPFFDRTTQSVQFDAMMSALEAARAGDVLLLHACCHNPTGAEFTPDQWRTITAFLLRKGVIPLIDIAYQGLGHGLDADATAMREVLDQVPEALIAASCSKNFGLYRDRIGSVWVKAANAKTAVRARATMVVIARTMWSMPPDHGASVVRSILQSDSLTALWQDELSTMRDRIRAMRFGLAQAVPQLAAVATQTGMFCLLPLSREDVTDLRIRHGVYMVETGRMNIAGLNAGNLPAFAHALKNYL